VTLLLKIRDSSAARQLESDVTIAHELVNELQMRNPGLVPHCVDEGVMANFPDEFRLACASHSLLEKVERRGWHDWRDVPPSPMHERHGKQSKRGSSMRAF